MARITDHPTSRLLVEGKDDFHVIHALCNRLHISVRNLENPTGGDFSVVDCNGKDNLIEQIPIQLKSSANIKTIGLIVDADSELQNRWTSLKGLLTAQGFSIPDKLPRKGLIATNTDSKRIGVWIMPNNNLNGMLEDFISFLVPKHDDLFPIVNSTLQNIEDQQLNKYSLIHRPKAVIHTWLSWQAEPETTMAQSITKRYLTTDEDTCLQLTNWLTELFS